MSDLKSWCLKVMGEFEPELREAAHDVLMASVEFASSLPEDRQVRASLLKEALARAEKRANEAGQDIGGRLAAMVLSAMLTGRI